MAKLWAPDLSVFPATFSDSYIQIMPSGYAQLKTKTLRYGGKESQGPLIVDFYPYNGQRALEWRWVPWIFNYHWMPLN